MTSPARNGSASRPARRVSELVLFVPRQAFWRILFWSLLVGLASVPFSAPMSPWIPVGVTLSAMVASHAVVASRIVPWIPGLTLTAACIQWVIAPWGVYNLPAEFSYTPMLVPAEEYFRFAVPCTVALAIGLIWPLARLGRRRPLSATTAAGRNFRETCVAMIVAGLATRIVLAPLVPFTVRFVASLVAALAIVGVCGLILTRAPGWRFWTITIVAVEAFYNTLDAQYLDLMLVVGFLTVIMIYRFQPRTRLIVAAILVASAALVTLNAMKQLYRGVIETEQLERDERPEEASATLIGLLSEPERIFAAENLAYNLERLNEGAIISRVMAWVPRSEPFAGGETIVTSIRSSLVPRIIDPDKPLAGGFVNYVRFTGFQLRGSTSINIAIAGEMFANFGPVGGVVGVFGYGLTIGLLFSLFVRWSRGSPLWWAWIPFMLYSTVSAEMGTNEVLNQITKSGVVMFAVIMTLPAWAALRRRRALGKASRRAGVAPLRTPVPTRAPLE